MHYLCWFCESVIHLLLHIRKSLVVTYLQMIAVLSVSMPEVSMNDGLDWVFMTNLWILRIILTCIMIRRMNILILGRNFSQRQIGICLIHYLTMWTIVGDLIFGIPQRLEICIISLTLSLQISIFRQIVIEEFS